jgi:transcriptional regulator with XRE-family HTH domain
LASPSNLANRFNISASRERANATKDRREATDEAREEESLEQAEESGSFEPLSAEAIREPEHGSDRITLASLPRTGRRGPWLPTEKRTEIAIAARTSGLSGGPKETQQEIAERFGISRQGVAHIKEGAGTVDNKAVEQAIESARNKALDRLMASLGLLTDDKLSGCSARDISSIAANMSRVVEKTMPDRDRMGNINLVIYSPELKTEKSFEVVEI